MTDKRYKAGIWITVAYAFMLGAFAYLKREQMSNMDPNEWGDFLAGAASPLAFLWLVLGYLQQGDELRQNTKALNLQVRELQASVDQQKAMVEAAKRQHEFELTKERDRRRIELLRSQPSFASYFQIEKFGPVTSAWKCSLKNVGPAAAKVTVREIERYGWLKVQPDIVLSFERDAEHSWIFIVNQDAAPEMGTIVIDYTDSNGELQKQRLQIALARIPDGEARIFPNGHPTLVFPEEYAV